MKEPRAGTQGLTVSGMGELECPEVPVSQKAIKTRFYKNKRKKKTQQQDNQPQIGVLALCNRTGTTLYLNLKKNVYKLQPTSMKSQKDKKKKERARERASERESKQILKSRFIFVQNNKKTNPPQT